MARLHADIYFFFPLSQHTTKLKAWRWGSREGLEGGSDFCGSFFFLFSLLAPHNSLVEIFNTRLL